MVEQPATYNCPMTRTQVIDAYFLEHRSKLVDIAAFLDRVERATLDPKPSSYDHRLLAMKQAITILNDGQPHRAKRVLELLSDPSQQPIETPPSKAATGAHPSNHREKHTRGVATSGNIRGDSGGG